MARTIYAIALITFVLGRLCAQEAITVADIGKAIATQETSWDDLSAESLFELWVPKADTWVIQDRWVQCRWVVTSDGRERVTRQHPTGGGVRRTGKWIEEASFNGEIYMSSSNQNDGSGSVGHQVEQFLGMSHSPKAFGLYVTGLEIGRPISLGQFLALPEAQVQIVARSDDSIVVRGNDPMAVGMTLTMRLDKEFGYRPSRIELRDAKGILTIFDEIEYQNLSTARGAMWFPTKGVWRGFHPTTRTEVSQLRYRLTRIDVDRHPSADEFVLTYPKGAMLLNTDARETIYLTADTSARDAPLFKGKTMSLEEHDRLAEIRRNTVPSKRSSR